MEGELKKVTQLILSVFGSLCYCYFVSAKIRRGWYRLISLLPVLYLFTVLPLSLSSAFNTFAAGFFIAWLGSFKLLLFAFDQGPLSPSDDRPISLPFFIFVACLPIKFRHGGARSEGPAKQRGFPLKFSVMLFAALVGLLRSYGDRLPVIAVMYAYIWFIFVLVEIWVSVSGAVIGAFAGVELELPSDEPYLATSLQELWGKRWNLTANNALRNTVYKPVRWAASFVAGDTWASLLGILASFVVSGLVHELLLYYLTHMAPTWEMTGFFVLQGFAVLVESVLKRAVGGKWRPPTIVSRVLTLGFAWGTSFLLFFPPVMRAGVDRKIIGDAAVLAELLTTKAKSGLGISIK